MSQPAKKKGYQRPAPERHIATWLSGPEAAEVDAFLVRERQRTGFPISRSMWLRKVIGEAIAADLNERFPDGMAEAERLVDAEGQEQVTARVG